MLEPEQFALLCFIVLMETHDGVVGKHPSYIAEKTGMLTDGYDAFGRLDMNNMTKVIKWHLTWDVPIPPKIIEHYRAEVTAFNDLPDDLKKAIS